MARDMHAATAAEVSKYGVVYPAWVLRCDIDDDPIYAWTGLGDYEPTGTGDPALDGLTFDGVGNVGEIGQIVDSQDGSSAVKVTLPGVDLLKPALAQVVFNLNTWQFRKAYIWLMFLDADGELIGQPIRVKTGRMDQMTVRENDEGVGTVEMEIESQQAYASEALATRYSEQHDIDSDDVSQRYVYDLANQQAVLGGVDTNTTVGVDRPGGFINSLIGKVLSAPR